MVRTIILLNIIVFGLWSIADGALFEFMAGNFLVSTMHLLFGRYWTLITSVFSHNMFFHLLVNMFAFYGFGLALEAIMGSRRFLIFYLLAGIFGSLGHCFVSTYFLHNSSIPALGASGAVSGVILLFSLMFPREKILILGILPIPAIFGALLFVAFDIWGVFDQTRGGTLPIGHGAHLGGALFGLIYYFLIVKRKMRPSEIEVV